MTVNVSFFIFRVSEQYLFGIQPFSLRDFITLFPTEQQNNFYERKTERTSSCESFEELDKAADLLAQHLLLCQTSTGISTMTATFSYLY